MRSGRKIRRTTKQYITVCIISLLVAGVAAAIISFKIIQTEKNKNERILNECYAEMNENKRQVYIAVNDIMAGEVLTEENLQVDTVYATQPQNTYIDSDDIGKDVLVDIQAGTQVLKSMVVDIRVDDDIREVEFETILISTNILENDFIDVRIVYPNGEDYTVLAKKVIKGYTGDSPNCFLWLTEEEILRMQSAVIDAYLYTGAYLYTTKYIVPNLQEATIVNYEPSVEAINLIQKNPNILVTATNEISAMVRMALENRLAKSLRRDVTQQQWELDDEYIFKDPQESKPEDLDETVNEEKNEPELVTPTPEPEDFNESGDIVSDNGEYGEIIYDGAIDGADLGRKNQTEEQEDDYDINYFLITEG